MSRSRPRPPASPAGRVAAVLLLVVVAFQISLAAGAPWGAAALGGGNPGVLPDELRVSSAVLALLYTALAAVAGTSLVAAAVRRPVLYAATALMVVGSLMNIASPSLVERMLWAPVTIALVIALWNAARHPSLARHPRSGLSTASAMTAQRGTASS